MTIVTPTIAAAPSYAPLALGAGTFRSTVSVWSVLGQLILWTILVALTFGIALMFFPYAFAKLIINSCELVEADGRVRRLHCDLGFGGQLGHILWWTLLTIITAGLAYPFYFYKVFQAAFNHTVVTA